MSSAFISYIKEDSEAVTRIADVLREFEVKVWLDKTALEPGLRWQDQIRKGIIGGDFFLACFSDAYVNRQKSYMNEELTLAIEELRQRPTDRAWFIPVKLTACEIPDRGIGAGETLRSIQWVDLDADWTTGMEKILSVIVPGSERIPRLIAQLDHQSARGRVQAIEALGRLGPLAKIAIPKLLGRISIESDVRTGLLPLAAISETLKNLGHTDTATFERIDAIFKKWGLDPTDARMYAERLRRRPEQVERLREILGEIRRVNKEHRYRMESLLRATISLAAEIHPDTERRLNELFGWDWHRYSVPLEFVDTLERVLRDLEAEID